MKTNKYGSKAEIIALVNEEYTQLIDSNVTELATSFVVIDSKMRKVIVEDRNSADIQIKSAESGEVVPFRSISHSGKTYRIYLLSEKIFRNLKHA